MKLHINVSQQDLKIRQIYFPTKIAKSARRAPSKIRRAGLRGARLRQIAFVGGRAHHEGRPAPDPFRDANFVRIARRSTR